MPAKYAVTEIIGPDGVHAAMLVATFDSGDFMQLHLAEDDIACFITIFEKVLPLIAHKNAKGVVQ